jgi:hypothetical protein
MPKLPSDQHITYQLQYRKCGKPTCSTCKTGMGHGPYWYAYWREGAKLRSGYIGKTQPEAVSTTMAEKAEQRLAAHRAALTQPAVAIVGAEMAR